MSFLSHSSWAVSLPNSLQQDSVEADTLIPCPGSAGATQLVTSQSLMDWGGGELPFHT